ncbi:MAG: glycosyltransferase family 4 protein [Armatimonadaceae bacterium]
MTNKRQHTPGFALEYSLGHTTHAQNLKRVLEQGDGVAGRIRPAFVDLPYEGMADAWAKLPLVRSNWSARASLGAYLGLRPLLKQLQAVLFHTQVTSLFSTGLMRRVPAIVSLDATPLQYDSLGAFYGHAVSGSGRIETLKKRMNERAFAAAKHLVTWSQWTKDSLVADYGVPPKKITVIPPGIDVAHWSRQRELWRSSSESSPGRVNLLFVGGDFPRKGGDVLLEAFYQLPHTVRQCAHLHIVTKTEDIPVRAGENISVYHGLTPNSEALLRLFAQADVFVFPTRGDCLPLAVLEALAAGLPVITTTVGALPEAVAHQQTGWIVPVDDVASMSEAIRVLIQDGSLRRRLGEAAQAAAWERFDATKNYGALLERIDAIGNGKA